MWYVVHDQNDTDYAEGNENGTSTKFETKNIKSSLCDYSDAYIFIAVMMQILIVHLKTVPLSQNV